MGNELLIYKSSAGSGKTYTLVLEYLKKVLSNPPHYKSILAITFTNKATDEMRTRVIQSLIQISNNQAQDLQKSITEDTQVPLYDLPERAHKVLELILHDYSRFSISTIDSFFSKMVRALARELRLPLRFDLELDQNAVSNEIVERLFDSISTDNELRKWLEEYIFNKLDNDKGWALYNDIIKISNLLFTEQYRSLFPDGGKIPDKEFINNLYSIKNGFEQKMKTIGMSFLNTISENNLHIDDFAYKKSGPAAYFKKILKPLKPETYTPNSYFLKAVNNAEGWYSKSSSKKQEINNLAESHLINFANQVIEALNNDLPLYLGSLSVLDNAFMAGIIGKLDQKLNEYRTEKDVVLISDNNLFLKRAMEGDDAHFMYEKSGNRYTHFLLDEFQDTSDFQWQNLLPLVQNALGSGNSTLIVGDAKQSIYRWRGGNLQLLQRDVQSQLNQFNSITTVQHLESNYRSRETIVEFNNTFFTKAPEFIEELNSSDQFHPYHSHDIHQQWKKGKPNDGFVRFKFFETIKSEVDEDTGEYIEHQSWKEKANSETLKVIHDSLNRGYSFQDIAILTRTNKEAKNITSYLVDNNIVNIISPESMQLNRNPKVQCLIDGFKLIHDPFDKIALANLAYYYQFSVSGNQNLNLHELFSSDTKTLFKYLPLKFTEKITELKKVSVYEVMEFMISAFDLIRSPDAYIQRLLDIVLELSNQNSSTVFEFLEWWDEQQNTDKCTVIIPSDTDAIRVMSIHKSKGLQFPIVILPYADWKLYSDHKTTLWVSSNIPPFNKIAAHPVKFVKHLENSIFTEDYHQELQHSVIDNLNLLYVALTRAEEQLYVYTSQVSNDKKIEKIDTTSKLIHEIFSNSVSWKEQWNKNDNLLFEAGNINFTERVKKDLLSETTELKSWISNAWKDRIKVVLNKQKIAVTDPESPELSYGIWFHNLAALIHSSINSETIINKYIEENIADETVAIKLKNDIYSFITLAEGQGWFNMNLKTINEADLLLNDGTILRPDRLIIDKDSVVVVDYKTGTEDKKHTDQVKLYAEALREMGFKQTKMFLFYPETNKLVDVNAN